MRDMNHSDGPLFTHGPFSRRSFLRTLGASAAVTTGAGFSTTAFPAESPIQGFEAAPTTSDMQLGWTPASDRKIRMGIVGYGVCQFGAAFGFQDHPNVEVVAVSDLIPDRCAGLAKACRCAKTYPSLEELVKDDQIEAVFVATDAPRHARHCTEVLRHGKHVASAVPAVFGSVEEAHELLATVKSTGLKYMMFETSCFHEDLYAMRQLYQSGRIGRVVYAEGEYYHFMEQPIDSFDGWRIGLPPQWYPTHSNAYGLGVTGGCFVEVSCMGMPSRIDHLKPANNRYQNPFGTEVALFRAQDGSMARMAVSWDTPGFSGELGRIRSDCGSFYGRFEGNVSDLPNLRRPPLPPGVAAGGHGGSHGYLADEFITSILLNRKPLIDIALALNMTVSGIVAHQSALKDGELLKIPNFRLEPP
jgi:predicted dehydrogenase